MDSFRSLFYKIFLICFPLCVQVGSASAADEKRFQSPLKNFSVAIPKGIGQRVQKENDNDGGMVSFHDDFGGYSSVFYMRLSPRSQELRKDPSAHRTNMEKFFDDFAMPWIFKPVAEHASILHREWMNIDEEERFFVTIQLPQGSTMFDAKSKIRHDTRRGLWVFAKGEFLYLLSVGEDPSALDLGSPDKPLQTLIELQKAKLKTFAQTIEFVGH